MQRRGQRRLVSTLSSLPAVSGVGCAAAPRSVALRYPRGWRVLRLSALVRFADVCGLWLGCIQQAYPCVLSVVAALARWCVHEEEVLRLSLDRPAPSALGRPFSYVPSASAYSSFVSCTIHWLGLLVPALLVAPGPSCAAIVYGADTC